MQHCGGGDRRVGRARSRKPVAQRPHCRDGGKACTVQAVRRGRCGPSCLDNHDTDQPSRSSVRSRRCTADQLEDLAAPRVVSRSERRLRERLTSRYVHDDQARHRDRGARRAHECRAGVPRNCPTSASSSPRIGAAGSAIIRLLRQVSRTLSPPSKRRPVARRRLPDHPPVDRGEHQSPRVTGSLSRRSPAPMFHRSQRAPLLERRLYRDRWPTRRSWFPSPIPTPMWTPLESRKHAAVVATGRK